MSTYSPDLRIELITTGDQAGTWGTTTNTNLGTIIEDAISGYTTVSVISSNQAFTALNGAADEARNAMIRLTTTTAANFAVYAPPSSKQYIIWNNSAYTATIYNSTVIGNTTAAGTGVAIASGDRVVVFSDGTSFYAVKSSGITGTLGIAQGGTGQTTANDAFNALAPSQASANGKYLKSDGVNSSWDAIDISTSDVTGVLLGANGGTGVANTGKTITLGGNLTTSGAYNVTLTASNTTSVTLPTTGTLATLAGTETLSNKTFVTPVLGTPASGTLTNCTGLPNAGLVNSSITINGNSVSLGGSTTVTATASNALTIGTGLSGTSYNGSTAVTIAIDSTVATLSGTQTLSNKTLVAPALGTPASGTLTNCTGLPNAGLVNSSITINGNSVSLGGSTTVTATASNALTIGTGLSGTSYNGSSAVTIAIDSTVATLSGVQTLTNKTLTSPTLTTPVLGTPASGTLTNCTGLPLSTGITGTLPVANGGTGTTTSTGSGSVVLSSSPTLTTPALGTPSSVTLTNATGLPLSTGVTGTLPVGNGGTGATTFTSGALLKGAGTSAVTTASAADIVGQIGATAVQNATTAATVSTTVSSGAVGTTQSNGDNSTKIATTAYVQNMGLGLGQTWQDVTASRTAGTTYTNSTGKPIQVSISCYNTSANGQINLQIGGVQVAWGQAYAANANFFLSGIVPPGASYVVNIVSGGIGGVTWAELR